jgi:1-aminocyclopropane-1-carboxylate deaminase/D-cysteine desulfhydrase-like pyridoxal-dependent ACC family enzyme
MLPRIPLCILPTPCHLLPNLSRQLGTEIWIKRDDLTGFAGGGNKGRKLEFLLAEAVNKKATAIVSCGATQSNFIRQLGAAAITQGIKTHVASMDAPYETPDRKPTGTLSQGGNPQLDSLFQIHRHHFADGTWDELESCADQIQRDLEAQGETVFRIPIGGSSATSVHAFVLAAQELSHPFDLIITASSSGSTHMGLAHAFAGTKTKIFGISADPDPELLDDLVSLSESYAQEFGSTPIQNSAINFALDFVGPGYGVPSPSGVQAQLTLAQTEGILLDPIYSAKAFAALLDLAQRNQLPPKTLFWHTGGLPTLFAYEA